MTPAEFDDWLTNPARPPLIMGVVNVTPDSFSDGGRYADPQAAIAHARPLLPAGAVLLDAGGNPPRPGAPPTPAEEQIRRIRPVIEGLAREFGPACLMSVDTTREPVAR